jgi:hypothetical protein
MPWTSDHRAVLSTLELTPVALPTTISLATRMLTEGDSLDVYVNAPGSENNTIAIVPEGQALMSSVLEQGDVAGKDELALDLDSLVPGGYDVLLLDADGMELAHNQFWLRSRAANVTLVTDAPEYALSEPVTVSWTDGPASRWDWIGVYRAAKANPHKDDYLLWGYTGGHDSGALPPSVSGTMTMGPDSQGKPWPLPPGDYVAHYLLADQYESAGSIAFTVTP